MALGGMAGRATAGGASDGLVLGDSGDWEGDPADDSKRVWSVLIDVAHGQETDSPVWTVDGDFPEPKPRAPGSAEDWDGALSGLAYSMWSTGRFRFVQAPPGSELRYGACSDRRAWSSDLACHDLLITVAPNKRFTSGELKAVERFVAAGGGLLAAAEHYGSNSEGVACDGDGLPTAVGPKRTRGTAGDLVDSTHALADLAVITGWRPASGKESPCVGGHPRTNEEHSNFIERQRRIAVPAGDPLLDGAWGSVRHISFERATSFVEVPGSKAIERRAVVRRKNTTRHAVVATSRLGRGRIAVIGDASLLDDGSSAGGRSLCRLRDPSRPDEGADLLVLNAVWWLAGPALDGAPRVGWKGLRPALPRAERCAALP